MRDLSDSDLVVRSQHGSKEAFAELYNRHKKRILNYLYGYIGNFASAQELAQEVFINAYKNISTFRMECKFTSWLYGIAVNMAKNYLIKNGKKIEISMNKPINDSDGTVLEDMLEGSQLRPDEELDSRIFQCEIQRSIDSLPEIYRQVLLLCDVEGLSYEEAAEVIRTNPGTVGSRLNTARRMFRKSFRLRKGVKEA